MREGRPHGNLPERKVPTLVRQVYTSPATGIFAPVFRETKGKEVLYLYSEQHIVKTELGTFSQPSANCFAAFCCSTAFMAIPPGA